MVTVMAPEKVVPPPPLRPAPTGLLQACVVIDEAGEAFNAPGGLGEYLDADRSEHLLAGVVYPPESAYQPILVDPCAVLVDDDDTGGRHLPPRYHHPLIIEAIDRCSSFGWEAADYVGRVLRALEVKEGIGLEREFESGAKWPDEPHLAGGKRYFAVGTTNGSAVVTSTRFTNNDVGATITGTGIPASTTIISVTQGVQATMSANATATGTPTLTVANPNFVQINTNATPVSPQVGFALLQEAIAESGVGQGMIHASSYMVERWAESHALLLPERGFNGAPVLQSVNGNVVVAGNGYRGLGPDSPQTGGTLGAYVAQTGQPGQNIAGSPLQWAYATDMIQLIRAAHPQIVPGGDTTQGAQEALMGAIKSAAKSSLDRGSNTVVFRSNRPYVVEFPGICHAAVCISATA
jgi:hypothetical protein